MHRTRVAGSHMCGHRATYLPDVFPGEPWESIREQILSKAGIRKDNDNVTFYVYDTVVVKKTIFQHELSYIKTHFVDLGIIQDVGNFMNKHYDDYIPYVVTRSGKVLVDKREYVRNIASIYDVLRIVDNVDASVVDRMKMDLGYNLAIYKNNTDSMRQASAFLVLALDLGVVNVGQKYDKDISAIVEKLYSAVIDGNLEEDFELGEVLMALSIVRPKSDILDGELQHIATILANRNANIFQLNWYMKFIEAYNCDKAHDIGLSNTMYDLLKDIVKKINDGDETNYIAVAYECTTCMFLCAHKANVKFHGTYHLVKEIRRLYALLVNRYNKNYGLFTFKDGSMRIDITGHILNGFHYMAQCNKKYRLH